MSNLPTDLVPELLSWVGWPEKELDVLLRNAAKEIERLRGGVRRWAGECAECNGTGIRAHANGSSCYQCEEIRALLRPAADVPASDTWECAQCKGLNSIMLSKCYSCGIPKSGTRPAPNNSSTGE